MKVNSKEQAWVEADKLFPTDYIKDEKKSDCGNIKTAAP